MSQQGDIVLRQTNDDGEIEVVNGVATMSGGLGTSAYLSLFGGNRNDSGDSGSALNWWGNLDETDPDRQYRSETQYLLRSLPATSGNRLRLQLAVERDLSWMLQQKIASSITVEVTMPDLNKVQIVVTIEARGDVSEFEFVENWRSEL